MRNTGKTAEQTEQVRLQRRQAAAEALAAEFGMDTPGDVEFEAAEAVLEALDRIVTVSPSDVDEVEVGTRFVPQTSAQAARDVMGRAKGQRWKLLREYRATTHDGTFDDGGMTDEEVADRVNLQASCYWKRCGELRDLGLIVDTGRTRPGAAGSARIVCRITQMGADVLELVNA